VITRAQAATIAVRFYGPKATLDQAKAIFELAARLNTSAEEVVTVEWLQQMQAEVGAE
jgi:hypothetical protein